MQKLRKPWAFLALWRTMENGGWQQIVQPLNQPDNNSAIATDTFLVGDSRKSL
jgi:hypothetical protein